NLYRPATNPPTRVSDSGVKGSLGGAPPSFTSDSRVSGGGIGNVLSATTTVDSSFLTNNQANGRGSGAGLGGGAYNDDTSTLNLTNQSSVTGNHANGQPGTGGGVYNDSGTFTVDALTVITGNHALRAATTLGLDAFGRSRCASSRFRALFGNAL